MAIRQARLEPLALCVAGRSSGEELGVQEFRGHHT